MANAGREKQYGNRSSGIRNGLFDGIDIEAELTADNPSKHRTTPDKKRQPKKPQIQARNAAFNKLRHIHTNVPRVRLWAEDSGTFYNKNTEEYEPITKPAAELLVVVSWRDSILAIPSAIFPDATGAYKMFHINERGVAQKPVTTEYNNMLAFMDVHHLHDPKCNLGGARYAVMRILPRSKNVYQGVYQLFEFGKIPPYVRQVSRRFMKPGNRFFSPPAFEVPPADWYYDELLRRLGNFIGLKHPVPQNNLTKYYQYMTMSLGDFHDMYSYVPDEDTLPTLQETVQDIVPHNNTIAEELPPQRVPDKVTAPTKHTENNKTKPRLKLRGGAL